MLPIGNPPLMLPTPLEVPFATVDVFNPLTNDTFTIKSHGMAVIPPGTPLPPPIADPARIGVNVWRVQKSPPAWCGYGYLDTTNGDYLLAPFRGESVGGDKFTVKLGACLDAVPPVP